MGAREIQAADGARLMVPAGFDDALAAAVDATPTPRLRDGGAQRGYAEWRTAFGEALAIALHDRRIVLAPLAFAASREAVDLNIYTLALDQKHAVERTLRAIADVFRPDPERAIGDLHGEFHAAVLALTGHAPLPGVGRVLGVEQRLRQLRELLLGIPFDEPEIPLPAAAVEAIATGGTP